MPIYLHDIPLPKAQARLNEALAEAGLNATLRAETIPLDENALGRVLAEPIWAKISSPREASTPWAHVRPMGEDMVATQLVLPAGHTLRPVDLGAIAGCGHSGVEVTIPPRVAILPTGTELIPIGQSAQRGDILEYNSVVLAAQVRDWGGAPTRYPITPDDFNAICEKVREAARTHDL
ncbi:MAG: hypothetical protein B5M51_08520, partial [Anaerolinea sp. 4484_236]